MRGIRGLLRRLAAGPKAPLIRVAEFLGMPGECLGRMHTSSAEGCQQVLLQYLEHSHGGVVDWRGRAHDVMEVVEPLLAKAEQEALVGVVEETNDPTLPAAVHMLDARLRPPPRALRAIGALGDAYIIFLAPREGLAELDNVVEAWLV